MPSEARPAATIIIIRDSSTGPEVLMLKRSGRAGFFPNAWVFPGGRVDTSDHNTPSTGSAIGIAETDQAFAIAAIRETYEEAGIWLGQGVPGNGLRDALNQRTTSLPDSGLVADLSRLALWSWWITPEVEPKRYDTRFFVALLTNDEATDVHCDEVETVEHRWVRPSEAVKEAEAGTFFLAPPTYLTLCELAACSQAKDVFKQAQQRIVRPIIPRLDMKDGQWTVVLPGDPSYPDEHPVSGPTKVEFRDGRWWQSSGH